MDGNGSERWNRRQKKRTVEESWTLDIAKLGLRGALEHPLTGTARAIRNTGDKQVLRVRYAVVQEEDRRVLNLTRNTGRGSAVRRSTERVELLTTEPNFGGVRWWFACPFTIEGERCNRRVAKLCLPPGEHEFGCRTCHDLTYRSSQESHKYDSLYAFWAGGERSGEVYEILKTSFSKLLKDARKRKKEEAASSSFLAAYAKHFGLEEWS
jgi:hypothetical protein